MRKITTLLLGVLFAGQTFTVYAGEIPNASETKTGEIWRVETATDITQLLTPANGVYGIHTYAVDQSDWDSQFFIVIADEVLEPGTPIRVMFDYRKDGEGKVQFNAYGFADPQVYVNTNGWSELEATEDWQTYEGEFIVGHPNGKPNGPLEDDAQGIRSLGVNASIAREDGTLLLRNIVIEVNYDEAVVTPETIWDDADFSDDNGGGNNNGNFSFNEWYTYGSMSNPYFESNDGSVSIYVPEGGNNWDLAFCNIFHNVDGQSVGNKFKLSFDVKWIGESSAESAQFHIFSGLNYYTNDEGYTVFVHKDDYQFNATENTEILFVGDFLANMDSLYTATYEAGE